MEDQAGIALRMSPVNCMLSDATPSLFILIVMIRGVILVCNSRLCVYCNKCCVWS